MSTQHVFRVERGHEWRFSAEMNSGDVWLFVFAGAMSGGVFLSLEQARELARIINAAADDLEVQRKIEDGGEPRFNALAQQQVTHGHWDEPKEN